jgi:hypothetical protein
MKRTLLNMIMICVENNMKCWQILVKVGVILETTILKQCYMINKMLADIRKCLTWSAHSSLTPSEF